MVLSVVLMCIMSLHAPSGVISFISNSRITPQHSSNTSVDLRPGKKNCSHQLPKSLIGAYYITRIGQLSSAPVLRHDYFSTLETQLLFDQGMQLLFGFNQIEAIRNFEMALVGDPVCFMCLWGIAQAARVNLNSGPTTKLSFTRGRESIEKAIAILAVHERNEDQRMKSSLNLVRSLLNATSLSFSFPIELDNMSSNDSSNVNTLGISRSELQYSDALRVLYRQAKLPRSREETSGIDFSGFGFRADVGSLFAESLLTLTPWQYYQPCHVSSSTSDSTSGNGSTSDSISGSTSGSSCGSTSGSNSGSISGSSSGSTSGSTSGSNVYQAGLRTVRMTSLAHEAVEVLRDTLCVSTDPTNNGSVSTTGTAAAPSPGTSTGGCSNHPLGLHLYIHLMEQIDNPVMALPAADCLASKYTSEKRVVV